MKKRRNVWRAAPLLGVLLGACSQSGAEFDLNAYRSEIMEWRAYRLGLLLEPEGYLNQTGLYWLDPGSYSFGTGPDNDIVFAGDGAARIGEFILGANGVFMSVESGVDVRHDGVPVKEIAMLPDTAENPVSVTHASLGWTAVEREGRYAIRLRDFELPFVKNFGPLPYFDINPDFRVQARLHRYPKPIISSGETVIEGLEYRPESPGKVRFTIGGEDFELEAFTAGDRLFYVFGDETNRDKTYGAGRFLYSAMPGDDGMTILDFNQAYSPPCAFNDFSTCPVASPGNRLSVRIEAGEIYDPALHYSPDH
ncbi:MAG TPA: DUF1684 domain-containing protein [Woeseiaceae bacterium]|nr:DUF1684 domain-containing protein [Woeseiaceae bacterium]